jgi:hypothetical protein
MCKAINYTEQLLSIYDNINSDVKRLINEVRTANLFNIDMLHKIMNTNFNACEGYKLAKQIKENQLSRQQSKYELRTLLQLKKHVNANIKLLNQVHREIVDTDTNYKYNIENKVYYPRVIDKKESESAITKPKFIPISVPSTPSIIGTQVHKKTNEILQVISKIDNDHYVVKRKKGGIQVMNKKNIGNLDECLQIAK